MSLKKSFIKLEEMRAKERRELTKTIQQRKAEAKHEERCWRIGGPVTIQDNGRCPECGWRWTPPEPKKCFWCDCKQEKT